MLCTSTAIVSLPQTNVSSDADVSDREVSALINGCYDRRKTYPIDALWESTAWACRYIFGENSVNFDRNSWIGMAGENASHIVTWKITNISGRRIILNYQICMNEMYYIIMSCRQCGGNCVSEGWTQHANEYRSEIFIFVK